MSRRLQQHAAHCTCSECTSRSLNGQDIRPHIPPPLDEWPAEPPPPPTVAVSGVEIPLEDIDDTDTPPPFTPGDFGDFDGDGGCDGEEPDNGPHSGAV